MRWFIPDGVAIPEHCPSGSLSVVTGCDGLPGRVINGIYSPGDWQKTAAGFFVWCDRDNAGDVLRLHQPPAVVEILHDGKPWSIPHLLTKQSDGFVSAVPRIYTPHGWQDPAHLAPVQNALRQILTANKRGEVIPDETIIHLVADIWAFVIMSASPSWHMHDGSTKPLRRR